jgi:hypothetical protein
MAASTEGHAECVRTLLAADANLAQVEMNGWTALMYASTGGHPECVRALLEAGADVVQAYEAGETALMRASEEGHLECVRALLEAGAYVMQPHNDGTCALNYACEFLELLQLLCAYAPSRAEVHAHFMHAGREFSPDCAQWLEATSRWTSQLHHFAFFPIERVRALLVAGADVRAGDAGPNAPTLLSMAAAKLPLGDQFDDGRAALIALVAAPWSPQTHALFPAGAKTRAVELLRLGWLLARRLQAVLADMTQVEVALRNRALVVLGLGHES